MKQGNRRLENLWNAHRSTGMVVVKQTFVPDGGCESSAMRRVTEPPCSLVSSAVLGYGDRGRPQFGTSEVLRGRVRWQVPGVGTYSGDVAWVDISGEPGSASAMF